MYDFVFEKFKNIYDFNQKINERKNNEVMRNENSSQKESRWSGTETYEESEKLLTNGWNKKVEEVKIELRKYSTQIEKLRTRYKPNMAGFAPIVPSAIKGVPKAMWMSEKKKVKERKPYLHIYFNNTGSADEDEEELMKSGLAVLKLCILVEKMGIKTKIDILPFACVEDDSVYGCGITLKDYRQPFNIQKMAYPIAHTSMFRRQGFKWLETAENIKNTSVAFGYGKPLHYGKEGIEEAYKKQYGFDEEGSIYISYYDCKRLNFDPEKLAKDKGLTLEIERSK